MRLRRRLLLSAAILALAAALLQTPAASATTKTLADRAKALGLSCSNQKTTDKAAVAYTFCTGEIPSFDDIGLDTDLTLPAGATGSLPTIVMMHGWGNDKTEWESTTLAGNGADKWHYNNVWFASKDWAVINYTARGFKQSCGTQDQDSNCTSGYTHLADRKWATKDTQFILGKLVDAGIAKASELAATGGSYGGGQTWLLSTSLPWQSPKGKTLQLAAGIAKYPWTDLLDSLTPNGRASDGVTQTRMAANPYGIEKESYVDGLYAVGRATGQGRYDTNPADYGTNLDEQYAFTSSGEPYDDKPNAQTYVNSYLSRSPYYATAYFNSIHNHSIPEVPVMSIQGWTDPLFPAVQTLQMFRKLKAADPNYPITMVFADIGHSNTQNPPSQWHPINTMAYRFLQAHVLGLSKRAPAAQVYSFQTLCPAGSKTEIPVKGSWSTLAQGSAAANGAGSQQLAYAPDQEQDPAAAHDGEATDPIANSGCMTEDDTQNSPTQAFWYWKVPSTGMMLLGLPKVNVDYQLTGDSAVIAFKLWDVASSGTKTLVTRGEYRLDTSGGDPASGTISTELYGNHWFFAPGDQVELEVAQTDSPYLRSDNEPFTVALSGLKMKLPLQQAGTITLNPGS